ncbi:winged helix-turn-helix transcriptional regulator (plasmid) [Halolamina sp. CBA1230]|uniref:winged helix-turn-helix domain-containing protein n=1 Tax=Halolamina sp. CBA1230 TaxID=1853690 RepID=UPI00117BBD91|nr:winged helix-turn-helix domain-containing protein [Halolamina sp. CBA1230]QKY21823.1 winged helix-turn-helix transcriptional regulator [Halolamina sp. CBA1230]
MSARESNLFSELDDGDVVQYVEKRVFGGKIDSLKAHIDRKKALAEPTRYSILYLLYEYGQVSRARLATETGRDSNDLQHHLNDLLETNLIAKIPAPEDADGRKTYYRITTLGKQEIASDIEHVVGGQEHENRFEMLADPELNETMPESGDRRRVIVVSGEDVESLDEHRNGLREKRREFQRIAGQE